MDAKLFQVDAQTREKALENFDKTEESLNEDIKIVREWLKGQPHLPEIMEDAKIRNFLFLNKCSIEKTKQKIDLYYTIRSLLPEFYDDSNPNLPEVKNYIDKSYCVVHPVLFEELYRVIFYKIKKSTTVIPRLHVILGHCIQEMRLYEDCMVGDVIVADMKHVSFNDIVQLAAPSFAAKAILPFQVIQKKQVYSNRLRALYLINSPTYITTFVSVLKKIVKPKIFERIQVHKGSEILKEVFPEEIVPKDYGGEGPSLEEMNDMIKAKFEQYKERFDELDKLKVNEDLRPEKLENDDLLGFYGNFKKLSLE